MKNKRDQMLKEATKLAAKISSIGSITMCVFNILVLKVNVWCALTGCIAAGIIAFILLKSIYHKGILRQWGEDQNTSK